MLVSMAVMLHCGWAIKNAPMKMLMVMPIILKMGLKWIFNITGLKKRLGVYSDDDLRKQNYDVDTYYRVENQPEESADDEMQSLYHNLAVEEGEPVYLEGGMYLYPDGSIR